MSRVTSPEGMSDKSTIVALSTPNGESAIATVRVSGPLSKSIAEKAFTSRSKLAPRVSRFGEYIASSGDAIDDCVCVFFQGPESYTGEDSLEISCHGNPLIYNSIISDLHDRGCIAASPGEFTRRAFLNGKMDLSQAEAVMGVISARSQIELSSAQKLLSGGLGKLVSKWSEMTLALLSEIESQIDFSDEDIEIISITKIKDGVNELLHELETVADSAKYGNLIRNGITIAILGAPNAGKSSLMNKLTGYERSIVSDEAGTTRDFISESLGLKEYRIRILDTAGLRENTQSAIERMGVEKTIECLETADLFLLVVDTSTAEPTLPESVLKKLSPKNTLIIFNKNDLPCSFDTEKTFIGFDRVSVSLLQSSSRKILLEKIGSFLEKEKIVPPNELLIVGERHAELLTKACSALRSAKEDASKISLEFVAGILRGVLEDLSEIVGTFDNEKVLDKVFSKFCIGK